LFDLLQAEVALFRNVRTDVAVETEALLPAILDRAFKGEL
jgi:hypothetical protein